MFNDKINWNKKYFTVSIYALIIMIIAILFYKIIDNLSGTFGNVNKFINILSPFFIGFLFTFLLNPGVMFFERQLNKVRNKKKPHKPKRIRFLSIFIMYILVLGAILLILIYIIPQLITNISTLVSQLTDLFKLTDTSQLPDAFLPYTTQITDIADKFSEKNAMFNIIESFKTLDPTIFNTFKNIIPQILQASVSFTAGFFDVILGIVISIYLISDKENFILQLKKLSFALLKTETANKLMILCSETNTIFKKFFIGKALDSLIIGLICFVFMSITKIQFAFLISIIICITNMIPYFGPYIGAIPSILIILMISPLHALWFIIFVIVLQQFDGIWLGPKILGGSVGLKPFWIIFAIILGGGLFGLLGMFLGVPFLAVIYNLCNKFINNKLKQKNVNL